MTKHAQVRAHAHTHTTSLHLSIPIFKIDKSSNMSKWLTGNEHKLAKADNIFF